MTIRDACCATLSGKFRRDKLIWISTRSFSTFRNSPFTTAPESGRRYSSRGVRCAASGVTIRSRGGRNRSCCSPPPNAPDAAAARRSAPRGFIRSRRTGVMSSTARLASDAASVSNCVRPKRWNSAGVPLRSKRLWPKSGRTAFSTRTPEEA